MKPPFMLLKSKSSRIPDPLTHTKNAVSDQTDLDEVILYNRTQSPRRFLAPKPPKKRYLEENYSQNKVAENNFNLELNNNTCDIECKDDVRKKKCNENVLFPDVNTILPDMVPKIVSKDKDIESRKSWRKKLLCLEKMDEFDALSNCDRLKPDIECQSNQLDKHNNSKTENPNNHCPKESSTVCMLGRRGRARACKGQKYREFMWTNVIHQRRKSSRWELCQDSVERSAVCDDNFTQLESPKSDHLLNNNNKFISRSSISNTKINGVDDFYKKKKIRQKSPESPCKKLEINKLKKVKDSPSPRKKLLKRDYKIPVKRPMEFVDNNEPSLIGSKKRKLRRQSIRRLEPGSDFKDTRVVEDTSFVAAANKMKFRK